MKKSRMAWVSLVVAGVVLSVACSSLVPLLVCSLTGLPFLLYDATDGIGKVGVCDMGGAVTVVEEDY